VIVMGPRVETTTAAIAIETIRALPMVLAPFGRGDG
jgi:hypothetical protein